MEVSCEFSPLILGRFGWVGLAEPWMGRINESGGFIPWFTYLGGLNHLTWGHSNLGDSTNHHVAPDFSCRHRRSDLGIYQADPPESSPRTPGKTNQKERGCNWCNQQDQQDQHFFLVGFSVSTISTSNGLQYQQRMAICPKWRSVFSKSELGEPGWVKKGAPAMRPQAAACGLKGARHLPWSNL